MSGLSQEDARGRQETPECEPAGIGMIEDFIRKDLGARWKEKVGPDVEINDFLREDLDARWKEALKRDAETNPMYVRGTGRVIDPNSGEWAKQVYETAALIQRERIETR